MIMMTLKDTGIFSRWIQVYGHKTHFLLHTQPPVQLHRLLFRRTSDQQDHHLCPVSLSQSGEAREHSRLWIVNEWLIVHGWHWRMNVEKEAGHCVYLVLL